MRPRWIKATPRNGVGSVRAEGIADAAERKPAGQKEEERRMKRRLLARQVRQRGLGFGFGALSSPRLGRRLPPSLLFLPPSSLHRRLFIASSASLHQHLVITASALQHRFVVA